MFSDSEYRASPAAPRWFRSLEMVFAHGKFPTITLNVALLAPLAPIPLLLLFDALGVPDDMDGWTYALVAVLAALSVTWPVSIEERLCRLGWMVYVGRASANRYWQGEGCYGPAAWCEALRARHRPRVVLSAPGREAPDVWKIVARWYEAVLPPGVTATSSQVFLPGAGDKGLPAQVLSTPSQLIVGIYVQEASEDARQAVAELARGCEDKRLSVCQELTGSPEVYVRELREMAHLNRQFLLNALNSSSVRYREMRAIGDELHRFRLVGGAPFVFICGRTLDVWYGDVPDVLRLDATGGTEQAATTLQRLLGSTVREEGEVVTFTDDMGAEWHKCSRPPGRQRGGASYHSYLQP